MALGITPGIALVGGLAVVGAGTAFMVTMAGGGSASGCAPAPNPSSSTTSGTSPPPLSATTYTAEQKLLFQTVKAQTGGNVRVTLSMLEVSYLESGWRTSASGGGAAGQFQIQLDAHPDVTEAEARNPVIATHFMLRSYQFGVASVPERVWADTTDPARAPEMAGYNAERPAADYYASQGAARVHEAYAAAIKAMQWLGMSTDVSKPGKMASTGTALLTSVQFGSEQSPLCFGSGGNTSDQGVGEVPSAVGKTVDVQRQAVVAAARSKVGLPYSFGGGNIRGPTKGVCTNDAGWNDCHITGFDCSGLVLYALHKIGLGLPHYAAAQWHMMQAFTVVAKGDALSRAKPGDIIFFTGSDGTLSDPGHVAIYIGNGQMIQAPQSGEKVQVSDATTAYWQSTFVGVVDPFAYLIAQQKHA